MYKLLAIFALLLVGLSGCGGGGGGGESTNQASAQGTAGITQLAAGALDGKWACVGGPLTFGQIINGNYTSNQILQRTYTTNITFSGLQYSAYTGATFSTLKYNTGIIKGPLTAPYYYGKTSLADKLIYERYLPVLSQSPKIGAATLVGGVSTTEGQEFSLDGNGKLLISYYSPTPLPDGLTYSSASGGPGEIGITSTTCNKV